MLRMKDYGIITRLFRYKELALRSPHSNPTPPLSTTAITDLHVDSITIPGFEDLGDATEVSSLSLDSGTIDPQLDFSINKSPLFGRNLVGSEFDEGAYWYPLKKVSLTFSEQGLCSIQAHYDEQSTEVFGSKNSEAEFNIDLQPGEYITGLSGLAADTLTDLTIQTSEREVHVGKVQEAHGTAFSFKVPENHEVVSFFGHADKLVTSLGVSYMRRLESIEPEGEADMGAKDPVLKQFNERLYLTNTLKEAIHKGYKAVDQEKNKFKNDLQPIYDKIKSSGFLKYRMKKTGEIVYLRITKDSSVIIRTRENKEATKFLVVSSYSGTTKLRSVSGWTWSNLGVNVKPEVFSDATAKFVTFLYKKGVAVTPKAAEAQFISSLNATGDTQAQKAAKKVPKSVASTAGMIISSVLVNFVWQMLAKLWELVFKEYKLDILFTNFDGTSGWKVTKRYDENVAYPGGPWRPADIPKYKPKGSREEIPGEDGEEGETIDDIAGEHAYNLMNDSKILQGLGSALIVAREDMKTGFALKYDIYALKSNKLALYGPIDPNFFNLKDYYKKGSWAPGMEASTEVNGTPIKGRTNALNGAKGDVYLYEINIGLPPL